MKISKLLGVIAVSFIGGLATISLGKKVKKNFFSKPKSEDKKQLDDTGK